MKKGEKTKELILSKSLELFAKNGFSGSSVRDISGAVGLRESALYNHFKSKSEILSQLLNNYQHNSTGLNLLTDELIDKLNKPLKFMQLFSEELIIKWSDKDEIRFLNLILKETGKNIDGQLVTINYYIEESQKVWIMIFTEMIKHKFVKNGEARIFANEFIAPLFFTRLQFLLDENNIDTKSAIKRTKEHTEFFWEGIKR